MEEVFYGVALRYGGETARFSAGTFRTLQLGDIRPAGATAGDGR